MDLRSILAMAQQPQSIPGLLQMLRGGDPQGGGGGRMAPQQGGAGGGGGGGGAAIGGGGWLSVPDQDNPNWNGMRGLQYRPITSPEDQNWSDLEGKPIHIGGGGPPPAFQQGSSAGGYDAVFDPRNPSKDGGWFDLSDYYKQAPEGLSPLTPGSRTGLSTNNWRLLPSDYRTPDYFMINGTIVSRSQMGRDLAPKSVMGTEGTGFAGYRPAGGGAWTTPFGSQGQFQGYIGAGNWGINSTPTY